MLNLETNVVYIGVLLIVALILLLIALIISYLKLMNKFMALKEGKDQDLDPQTILSQAQIKSQKILEQASIESRKMIINASEFIKREDSEVAKELDKISKIYIDVYSKALEDLKINSSKTLENLPNEVKTFLVTAIDDFRLTLSHEIAKVASGITNALNETYAKAAVEVENYKKERMRQIDNQVLSLIQKLSEKVLGKEISSDEHEKMVFKALEEAKRQGIL